MLVIRRLLLAALLVGTFAPTPLAPAASGADPARRAARTLQVVSDPGFEDVRVTPCFRRSPGSHVKVRRTTHHPLKGRRSLDVRLAARSTAACAATGVGRPTVLGVLGALRVANLGKGRRATVTACLQVGTFGSGKDRTSCTQVRAGSRRVVRAAISPASPVRLTGARWTVTAAGRAHVVLDDATIRLTVPAPSGTCDPTTEAAPYGPPDPASACNDNVVPTGSDYHPATLHLRTKRPYLPLDDYTAAPASDPVAQRFTAYVDRALAGDPDYGYGPADAVVQYARTHQVKYLRSAIADVDAHVKRAESAIAHGDAPDVAGDSYLEIGPDLEQLALAYDWGYDRLTPAQRTRWRRYGDQALANLWSPQTATWGSAPAGTFAWSGWSINNPGNNYNFSFVEATQAWALATRDRSWMSFLQTYKFPLITDYYEQLYGGGSREGTGYGTAQRRLWANARTWADGTGEHLAAVETHARQSIDYWVHATVPTLDYFVPIGDLSRVSVPELYDYQENLVREAAMAAPGTPAAGRALWWIAHNSVPDTMSSSFNLRAALLRPTGTATAPTATSYDAPGVGVFFARSSWAESATWLAVVAGPYDESHAHEEQGAFTLYDGTWQSVTANIWSHSGLQGVGDEDGDLGTGASSILRFDTKIGAVPQRNSTSSMTTTSAAGTATVHADLSPAYADSDGTVISWTRDLSFAADHLAVADHCTVGAGVTPVWQLQVPVEPTVTGPGGLTAGDLQVTFDPAYDVALVDLHELDDDLLSGWRIELTHPGACEFEVALDVD